MDSWIKPILDFLFKLADKYGTKFLVALSGVGGLTYMVFSDKLEGLYGAIGIVLIAVTYFWARRNQEKEQVCECEPEPEEKPE